MHKVFISYHHENDQRYKKTLIECCKSFSVFMDKSVESGDFPENLDDQAIRKKIRDEYLRDSTVTILLAGTETKRRKHVDWELYSSMFDGTINKKSGVLVVNLPSVNSTSFVAAHGDAEKQLVYPDISSWTSIDSRQEQERRFPHLPDRIIDNLLVPKARISVVPWERLSVTKLEFLIDSTFQERSSCEYDLHRPMKRQNA